MKDYERDFLFRINGLAISGPVFARLARETLREIMGEAGSSVVLYGLNKNVLESPERLTQELSSIFGWGAIPILKALVVGAIAGPKGPDDAEFQGTLPEISAIFEDKQGLKPAKQTFLHDHRVKDEMAEYFESLDEEQASD